MVFRAMAERAFFDSGAKGRATAAIKTVEAQTSCEIVISVRHSCGSYRAADLTLGAVFAMTSLAVMIYSPRPFRSAAIPLDVAIAFGVGMLASWLLPALRRLLNGTARVRESVDSAAKTAFYDLGIAKTHRRQGILVFASMLEKRCKLVADVGVTATDVLAKSEVALQQTIARRDFDAFVAAVEALGPLLGETLPHKEGDENELPDEMQ